MLSPYTVSWRYILPLLFIAITYFPEQTSSAPPGDPKTKKIPIISEDLLHYTQGSSCVFPVQSDLEDGNVVFKKLDQVCTSKNETKAVKIGETRAPSTPVESLCLGVAQVVIQICNKTSSLDTKAQDVKAFLNLSFDDEIAAQKTTNVTLFCESLVKDGPRNEDLEESVRGFYQNFLLPILGEESKHCLSVCENKPVDKAINGDNDLKINPACLVFKKGYEVLRRVETLRLQAEKAQKGSGSKEVVPQDSPQGESTGPIAGSKKAEPDSTSLDNPKPDNKDQEPEAISPAPVKPVNANSVTNVTNKKEPSGSVDPAPEKPSISKPEVVDGSSPAGQKQETDQKKGVASSSTTSTTPSSSAGGFVSEDSDGPVPPKAEDVKVSSPKPKTENIDKNNKPSQGGSSKVPSGPGDKPKTSGKLDTDLEGDGGEIDEYPDGVPPSEDNTDIKIGADDVNSNFDSPLNPELENKQPPKGASFHKQGVESLQIDDGKRGDINLYIEDDGGGFFNYFLFFVTFLGLCFLIFHNKRRLLAYVVEGRNPRSTRSRRRSSSASGASYRKLENNFE